MKKPHLKADPALSSSAWRAVRKIWIERRWPCSRCGGEIDYDSPRFYPGTKKVNRATLAVGHIVSRDAARAAGWDERDINSLNNSQPEHAFCSDSSGGKYARAKQRADETGGTARPAPQPRYGVTLFPDYHDTPLITSQEW